MKINSQSVFSVLDRLIHSKRVWVLFFLCAFIIFCPFFLYQKFIVSTTDSVFAHYPNLIFGHEKLRQGYLPLWNPYFFGGTDFTKSMHHHMLNLANWPLVLLPRDYLLYGVTFIQFVQISLIGVIGFKGFKLLCSSSIVCFASALLLQLSNFTWFTTSTFIGVEFFFLTVFFCYVILSYEKRRALLNFVYMALISGGMFMEGHVGYIAAFFFPIICIQVIRHRRRLFNFRDNPNLVFAFACLVGFMMGFYRLYPILSAQGEAVIPSIPPINHASNAYKLLTGFIPAAFGIDLGESVSFFSQLSMDGHIQFHNLLYMGLLTAFLAIFGLRGRFNSTISTLSWLLVLVIFGSLFMFQVATDIIYFFCYPFVHSIIFRVAISFLAFSVFFLSFKRFQYEDFEVSKKDLRVFFVFIGMVLSTFIAFVLHSVLVKGGVPGWILLAMRCVLTALFIGTVWGGMKFPIKLEKIQRLSSWIFIFALGFFCMLIALLFRYKYFFSVYPAVFYHIAITLWSVSVLFLIRRSKLSYGKSILVILSGGFALYVVLLDPGQYHPLSGPMRCSYPFMGVVAFLVAVFVLWELFVCYYLKKISQKVFGLSLLLFCIGDLVFSLKIYSYSGAPPFLKEEQLYPTGLGKYQESYLKADSSKLDNFRVNYPGNDLLYPYFHCFSNAFMLYNVKTIGGIDSVINQPFLDYLEHFTPMGLPHYGRGMVFPGIEHQRIRELFGIRYSFPETRVLDLNEKAVSRFASYESFIVSPDLEETMEILKDPEFCVDQTIILQSSPIKLKPQHPSSYELLDYHEIETNKIHLNIKEGKSKIILFNDTYDEGWKATWNGRPIPIMLANGYFMAVEVPGEVGSLDFSFQPKFFWGLIKTTFFILFLLLGLLIYSLIQRKRRG